MTAIHEQLVRDHVGQLIRDAHRANRAKLAHRGRRRCRRRSDTRDPAAPRPA